MRPFLRIFFFASAVSVSAHAGTGKRAAPDLDLSAASWIWYPTSTLPTSAPAGSVSFLRTIQSPTNKTATAATILVAADNSFVLWVNGHPIGQGEGFTTAQTFAAALNGSSNTISVSANNALDGAPEDANPAGLLALVEVLYSDGSRDTFVSDDSWRVMSTVPDDFPLPAATADYVNAQEEGKAGTGPWGAIGVAPASALTPDALNGSSWLWCSSGAATDAPEGSVGFRLTFTSPAGRSASNVSLLVTADNTFTFFLNDARVASPPPYPNTLETTQLWVYAQRITAQLDPGRTQNTFTFLATNFASQGGPNPAGFITTLLVAYSDGTTTRIQSDASWLCASVSSSDAPETAFLPLSDSQLAPATVQAAYGDAPWGKLNVADALDVRRLGSGDQSTQTQTASASSSTELLPPMAPTDTHSVDLVAPTSMLPTQSASTGRAAAGIGQGKKMEMAMICWLALVSFGAAF
ncbi:hypothetical protein MKEN_00002400 [Mycena kentingensis (nom. inval.)]|nr:hypothetical protein MKEN_00002400 [Mycena kentingensis (nom. inval.)]